VLAFNTQGMRQSMWPCVFGTWISIISRFFEFENYIVVILNTFGFFVSFTLFLAFGDGTFSKVKLTGAYQVGHKEYHIKKNECAVSVFYPLVDQANPKVKHWLNYRKNDESIRGFKRS